MSCGSTKSSLKTCSPAMEFTSLHSGQHFGSCEVSLILNNELIQSQAHLEEGPVFYKAANLPGEKREEGVGPHLDINSPTPAFSLTNCCDVLPLHLGEGRMPEGLCPSAGRCCPACLFAPGSWLNVIMKDLTFPSQIFQPWQYVFQPSSG